MILSGAKTVETRTYPLPKKYVGQTMLVVETPGRSGKFKSRIVARIVFGESFQYKSKAEFYLDQFKHHVDKESPWAWGNKKKWGWPIEKMERLKKTVPLNRSPGIVYSIGLSI
jgi:hypothetical protein